MKPPHAFNFRAFVTLVVGFAFTLMALSGLALYFAPRGSHLSIGQWTLLGLDREQWLSLHFAASLTVLFIAAFHLYNNRKAFWNYLHGKAKAPFTLQRELVAASLVAALLALSAVFSVPPASLLVTINETLKDRWERPSEFQHPGLEEMTLRELARELAYSDAQMMQRVEASQLDGITLDHRVREVMRQHDLRLQELKERLELRGLRRVSP